MRPRLLPLLVLPSPSCSRGGRWWVRTWIATPFPRRGGVPVGPTTRKDPSTARMGKEKHGGMLGGARAVSWTHNRGRRARGGWQLHSEQDGRKSRHKQEQPKGIDGRRWRSHTRILQFQWSPWEAREETEGRKGEQNVEIPDPFQQQPTLRHERKRMGRVDTRTRGAGLGHLLVCVQQRHKRK